MDSALSLNLVLVVVSIGVLTYGADWIVEGAAALAKRLGVSELVIGLTIVAAGTSAPEFVVTVTASLSGQSDISVANVVGSNIFNLGFILGGCALLSPIPTSRRLVSRDCVVLVGSTLLLVGMMAGDLTLGRVEGGILVLGLVLYLAWVYRDRSLGLVPGEEDDGEEIPTTQGSTSRSELVRLLVGFAAVVGGSHLLVTSASAIARSFGISDWVIGVTIVAAGTSAPEFMTSLVAGLKGHHDISAGNLVGSDIFNLLGILGLAGILHPLMVDEAARISLFALVGMVVVTSVFIRTDWKVTRTEGGILVSIALARWYFDFATRI